MTKVKTPPEGKIYDSDGYWLRAAAVCVKDDSESENPLITQFEGQTCLFDKEYRTLQLIPIVLLVTSSGDSENWIIPGGKVQLNECPAQSAIREAREEGGVVGHLGRCLGVFDNGDKRHRTRVYVLKVSHLLDEFDEKEYRDRQWFGIDEALKTLVPHKPTHLKYLLALRASKVRNRSVLDSHCPEMVVRPCSGHFFASQTGENIKSCICPLPY